MSYDDATVPMYNQGEAPTWPTTPPARARVWRGPRRPPASPGCGLALAIVAAFLVGAAFAAVLTAILVAPRALPPATSNHTAAALKLTLTDNFFDQGLNASDANGLLTGIQTHIQPDGELKISGTLRGSPAGSGQTATFVFAPTVSQGRIKVAPISGSVGALPVPAAVLSRLAAALNLQLASASAIQLGGGQQLTVQRITFADGELTISYA
jgi:hypothetical protein